jgi:hypothetical protein
VDFQSGIRQAAVDLAWRRKYRTHRIWIEDRTVGLVIGKGGATVRQIQTETSTEISTKTIERSIEGKRPVDITGPEEGIARAEEKIRRLVKDSMDEFHANGDIEPHARGLLLDQSLIQLDWLRASEQPREQPTKEAPGAGLVDATTLTLEARLGGTPGGGWPIAPGCMNMQTLPGNYTPTNTTKTKSNVQHLSPSASTPVKAPIDNIHEDSPDHDISNLFRRDQSKDQHEDHSTREFLGELDQPGYYAPTAAEKGKDEIDAFQSHNAQLISYVQLVLRENDSLKGINEGQAERLQSIQRQKDKEAVETKRNEEFKKRYSEVAFKLSSLRELHGRCLEERDEAIERVMGSIRGENRELRTEIARRDQETDQLKMDKDRLELIVTANLRADRWLQTTGLENAELRAKLEKQSLCSTELHNENEQLRSEIIKKQAMAGAAKEELQAIEIEKEKLQATVKSQKERLQKIKSENERLQSRSRKQWLEISKLKKAQSKNLRATAQPQPEQKQNHKQSQTTRTKKRRGQRNKGKRSKYTQDECLIHGSYSQAGNE